MTDPREPGAGRPGLTWAPVTDAQPGRSVDRHKRQRNYLISMSIRVLCFLGLVVTPGPWRWAFAVGAAIIPAFAVMLANVSSKPYTVPTAPGDEDADLTGHQLGTGEVIRGEVVDD
ncbi:MULTISPECIES: DUF3099 domain-containing protein [Aestuariimicrobium]|uniref:DUF3099 domain-containing protein n=1 Tax=Aestuariimicrobium TaxID=396388 RepID=UPI0003B488CC|nr:MULTISPECIES: DUF3099 domain-containing protein [Aestuariimicrobium]CAI9399077.1 hypothetical protein AESSP_00120 [Aestuariimicrobium sp. T2.26MG-19.2B]